MPAVDAEREILEQPYLAAGAVPVVAREREEVEAVDDRNRARKVGDEDDRRRERRDENRLATLVVGSDLRSELRDPALDLLLGEVDLPDPGIR
jgi:hypothetical protein